MLVEINLLPKKEAKKSAFLLIVVLTVVLLGILSAILFFQGRSMEMEMRTVDKEIESIQKLNALQQDQLAGSAEKNSAKKLKAAVNWVGQYSVETVPLLRNVIVLLPERGFIKEFEYSGTGSVMAVFQFDSSRDAAFYLGSLNQAEWVKEASILSVTAEGTEEMALEPERDEGSFLPRYTAEYEIRFKQDYFKKNWGADVEGGEGK